jgi:hypothetical protein
MFWLDLLISSNKKIKMLTTAIQIENLKNAADVQ